MKLERTKTQDIPDYVVEAVDLLLPQVDHTWEIILISEDQKNFGVSARDGELVVNITNSKGAKNLVFSTDGTWVDGISQPGSDGYSRRRHIVDWTYCLITNLVTGQEKSREIKTCYLKDAIVWAQLRARLGLR